jgi:hypothetical protein
MNTHTRTHAHTNAQPRPPTNARTRPRRPAQYVVRNPDGRVELWKPGTNFSLSVPTAAAAAPAAAAAAAPPQPPTAPLAGAARVRDAWDGSVRDVTVEVVEGGVARPITDAEREQDSFRDSVRRRGVWRGVRGCAWRGGRGGGKAATGTTRAARGRVVAPRGRGRCWEGGGLASPRESPPRALCSCEAASLRPNSRGRPAPDASDAPHPQPLSAASQLASALSELTAQIGQAEDVGVSAPGARRALRRSRGRGGRAPRRRKALRGRRPPMCPAAASAGGGPWSMGHAQRQQTVPYGEGARLAACALLSSRLLLPPPPPLPLPRRPDVPRRAAGRQARGRRGAQGGASPRGAGRRGACASPAPAAPPSGRRRADATYALPPLKTLRTLPRLRRRRWRWRTRSTPPRRRRASRRPRTPGSSRSSSSGKRKTDWARPASAHASWARQSAARPPFRRRLLAEARGAAQFGQPQHRHRMFFGGFS